MQTCGIDYRTAYEVVGVAVRAGERATGLRGIDLDGALLDAAAQRADRTPARPDRAGPTQVLDPRPIVETRTAAGGAAPAGRRGDGAATAGQAARDLHDLAGAGSTASPPPPDACWRQPRPSRPPTRTRQDRQDDACSTARAGRGRQRRAAAVRRRRRDQGRPVGPRRLAHSRGRRPGRWSRRCAGCTAPLRRASTRPTPRCVRRLDTGVPPADGVRAGRRGRPGLARPHAAALRAAPSTSRTAVRPAAPLDARRRRRGGLGPDVDAADRLLAAGEVTLEPANRHDTVVPMATAIGPSAPVLVVENARRRTTTAFAPLNQGPGDVAWFGRDTPGGRRAAGVPARGGAPVLRRRILDAAGPLDVLSLAAQGGRDG